MAKFKMTGLDEYVSALVALGRVSNGMIKRAVYDGAAVVADEVRAGIDSLPEREGITKAGLREGLGLSQMKDEDGYINTALGFAGYNARGVPNILMARIMESGTSKVRKHPFIRPALKRVHDKAIAAMTASIDKDIKNTMEG